MEFELDKWRMNYSDDIVEHFRDRGLTEKMAEKIPQPFLREHARHYIDQRMFNSEEKQYCRAIVCDGRAVGGIDVFIGRGVYSRSAEITIWVAPAYQNKHIGTGAIESLCKEVFTKYSIKRIFARVYSDDEISCRLFAGAGFECEGVLRKSVLRNGELLDQKIYAIVSD